MKALISPDEKVRSYDGMELGLRIAQIFAEEFPVPSPMFWVDCADDCIAYNCYYADGQIHTIPPPPEPLPEEVQN